MPLPARKGQIGAISKELESKLAEKRPKDKQKTATFKAIKKGAPKSL
jgi:hypothetical protein